MRLLQLFQTRQGAAHQSVALHSLRSLCRERNERYPTGYARRWRRNNTEYKEKKTTIKAPFPHMVLNSHNVPGEEYEMWNTWKVAKSTSVDHMVDWIATVAKGAPDGKLETLIFNAHGSPGKIKMGQGITRNHVEKFSVLNSLLENLDSGLQGSADKGSWRYNGWELFLLSACARVRSICEGEQRHAISAS